jgi:hypothetical protein
MSGSSADLDGAIARLNKAMGALEARVQDLKFRADSPRLSGDDDLFADRRQDSERSQALEDAAREASKALDQAAAEIRAVLEEA